MLRESVLEGKITEVVINKNQLKFKVGQSNIDIDDTDVHAAIKAINDSYGDYCTRFGTEDYMEV